MNKKKIPVFSAKAAGWEPETLPEMHFFTNIFQVFCSEFKKGSQYFRNLYFPDYLLVVATNRCKVVKTFISKIFTAYLPGGRLGSEKT